MPGRRHSHLSAVDNEIKISKLYVAWLKWVSCKVLFKCWIDRIHVRVDNHIFGRFTLLTGFLGPVAVVSVRDNGAVVRCVRRDDE